LKMKVRIASEAWICWSFAQSSESRFWTWILIWISSWDPLKLCDAIRRTTSAPPGQNPGRARPRSAHSPLQSDHNNAPINPVRQSNLSKIVALLTAIIAFLRLVRIAFPLWRFFLAPQRGRGLALSGDPVDQTCGIEQRCCLIEELLDVESDFKTLLMKARTGTGIGCAFPRLYQAGYGFQLNMT
jgi:hypothetical protein